MRRWGPCQPCLLLGSQPQVAAAPALLDRPLQHYSQNHRADEGECIFPLRYLRASASDQNNDNKWSLYRILLARTPAFWAARGEQGA